MQKLIDIVFELVEYLHWSYEFIDLNNIDLNRR